MPVVNPQESELSNYYELSMQEAMQTYILSHLAVTNRGLWVLPNGINTGSVTPESGETEEDARARTGANYKVLLSNDGMSIYDGTGKVIASYGSNIRFSSDTAQYIGGENAYIVFDPTTGSLTIGGSLIRHYLNFWKILKKRRYLIFVSIQAGGPYLRTQKLVRF